jgi:DNA-binding YbaB/EbfC family protein
MLEGFDFNNMAKMMSEMQAKAKEIEQKTKETILTSKGGGGMVSVSANGAGEIVDITIDDSLMDDKESLQILLISTINDLLKSVENNKSSQMLNIFGGVNPFGFGNR